MFQTFRQSQPTAKRVPNMTKLVSEQAIIDDINLNK